MSHVQPLILAAILTTSAWAQSVISAHSGVIHYKEGQVEGGRSQRVGLGEPRPFAVFRRPGEITDGQNFG